MELIEGGAALGDRFVAVVGEPDGPGWVPAAELFGAALPEVLEAVGRARGTDSPAVAGALLYEQYALRLAAPVLVALVRDGAAVDARLGAVRALLVDGVLRRVAFARGPDAGDPATRRATAPVPPDAASSGPPARPARPAHPGPPDAVRARVLTDLVAGNLDPAAAAVHRRTRVGWRVLRGAVANAVASALLHLSWPDADRARHVDDAHDLLALVPGLAGLVTVEAREALGERWMYTDRATCCLAFRTTVNQAREQRYCGTCPVLPKAEIAALFARATARYAALHPRP